MFGMRSTASDMGRDESAGLSFDVLSHLDKEDGFEPVPLRSASSRRRSIADDDMSEDDDADVAPLSGLAARLRGAPTPTKVIPEPTKVTPEPTKVVPEPTKPAQATAGPNIAAQVSECKAMLTQLQQFKEQKLQQEDYMGAHHVKQLIQEQESKLQQLRQQLDSMPTPARLGNPSGAAPAAGRRGPRVSIAVGPKRKREKSPGVAGAAPHSEASASMPPPVATTAPPPAEPARKAASEEPPAVEVDDDEDMPQQSSEPQDGEEPQEAMEDEAEEACEDADEEELEAGQWRACPGNPDLVELPHEKPELAPFTLPRDVFERLYPYQRAGVAWMARIHQSQQGGILADEMGLGKTIQVCALLNGARKAGATHALLLLPVTLLDQWAKEARIWCPGWPVYTYYGSQAQRVQALRRVQRPEGGLLLTSYSMLGYTEDLFDISVDDAPSPRKYRKGRGKGAPGAPKASKRRRLDDDDVDEGPASEEEPIEPEIPASGLPSTGSTKPWDIVVCDEAHKMKNISTLLGKSLRRLQSRSRILLTGTPVQNALQDLWALLDFAQPGLLGNHATFVKTFSDPIDRGSVRGAKVMAVELKKHLAAQLRALISPHLLRRTKANAGLMADEGEGGAVDDDGGLEEGVEEEVQDAQAKKLPPKKETIVWCMPSEEQMSAYQKVLEKSEVIREACTKQKLGIEVFRAIGLLKRLCNHPLLLLPTAKPGDWAQLLSECQREVAASPKVASSADEQAVVPSEAVVESLGVATGESDDARAGRAAEMMLRKLPRSIEGLRQQSAKLRCLAKLLPALAERGHRTLVFSCSPKMLDLIQICCLKPNGLPCLRIDGQTDPMARHEKVAKFQQQQSRFKCMLLTTTVGGVGLNLTSADRVILVDPAWNPATDAQAVDRAFRIGQEREVRVYRLVMSGLIEDKMFRLQVFKMGLTKTALEAGQQHTYFTAREIRALFDWTDPAEGETRKLLMEKHGQDREEAINAAAEEDGSADGWFDATPTAALSDFSAVYGCVAHEEEEKDENVEAQAAEAKQKLGAADEKLQMKQEARKAAEAHSEKMANDLKEAIAQMDQIREKRARTEEALKEARAEAKQARSAEASVSQRLEKAMRNRTWAQEQHLNRKQAREDSFKVAEISSSSANDAVTSAKNQDETIVKFLAEAEGQLSAFDEGGRAAKEGPVDAAADRVRKALKALEKLRAGLDAAATRQAELDGAEAELAKAEAALGESQAASAKLGEADGEETDAQAAAARKGAEVTLKNREKEKQRAEQALTKAQSKAEAAREAVVSASQAFSEAGVALADSFKKTESRPVKMDKVKEAQTNAKAAFRQVASAATAAKKAREACVKAIASRRKALQKAYAAAVMEAEQEAWLEGTEQEFSQASTEEEARRNERAAKEAELSKAEAARSAAEVEEAETKKRRDDLKAAKPAALEAVKAARAAEKEATNQRQALHAHSEKAEKDFQTLERAKNSAVQTLMAEEYDAQQVQQAYERSRKAAE